MLSNIRKNTVILLALLAVTASATKAQGLVDTITPKSGKLITAALKPGLRQYLVYGQTPVKDKVLALSYWVRDIKTSLRNGEKVILISQHWYSADTLSYRTVYSVNRAVDFAPLYHTQTLRNRTQSFNWGPNKVTSADTVAANDLKSFNLTFKTPNFNWNLDIETFEQLPLAAGKTFAINFYDAGIGEPKYVLYKVSGSETLTMLDNTKAVCWKLITEGKAPNGAAYSQTFWITQKGHEFIKEEDNYNGNRRTKIKLPGSIPNVVANFKL
jgi:hypothetical protein